MSKKILCKLPFASASINGVDFEPVDGGMQSVDVVPDDVAENFLQIEGYEAVEVESTDPAQKPSKKKE
jgi:hypothetical protein